MGVSCRNGLAMKFSAAFLCLGFHLHISVQQFFRVPGVSNIPHGSKMVKIIEPSITGQLANEDEQTVNGDLGNVLEEVYRSTEKPTFHKIANKRRNIFGKIPKPEPDSGDLTTTEQSLPVRDTSRVQKFGRISKTQAATKSLKPSRERHVFGRLPQPISKKIRAPVQDLADNDPDLSQLFKKVAKPLPLDTENDDLVIAPRVDQSSGALSISKSPEPTFASASKKSFSFQRISKVSKSSQRLKSPASRPSITAKETTSHRTQPILERSIKPAQSQLSSNPTQVANFRLFNSINQPSKPRIV